MSADLFAQFGPFSGSSQQPAKEASNPPQQGQSSNSGNANKSQPSDDPFAFLASAFPNTTPQTTQAQQPQVQSSSQEWGAFSAPAQPAATSSNWGDSNWGNLGGLGTMAVPAAPAVAPISTPVQVDNNGGDNYDDDDTWGDFEDATKAQPAAAPAPTVQVVAAASASIPVVSSPPLAAFQASPTPAPAPAAPRQQPKTRVARASTIDLMSNTLVNFGDDSLSQPQQQLPAQTAQLQQPQQQRQPWRNPVPEIPEISSPPREEQTQKKAADPNVLFDAEENDGTEDFDDDDEFGDFETGQQSVAVPEPPVQSFAPAPRTVSGAPARAPVAALAPRPKPAASVAPTTHLVDLLSLADSEPSQPPPPAAPPLASSLAGLSTQLATSKPLSSSPRKQPHGQLLSPLSFGNAITASSAPVSNYPEPPKSPSFQQRNPFPGLALATPNSAEFPKEEAEKRSPSPPTAWPIAEPNDSGPSKPPPKTKPGKSLPAVDDWEAWDNVDSLASKKSTNFTAKPTSIAKPAKPAKAAAKIPDPEPTSDDWDWEAEDVDTTAAGDSGPLPDGITKGVEAKSIPDTAPPPTNVPPPSILLSVFPSLLALPDEALFKPLAGQSGEARSRILGDPQTIAFLRNYLQLAVVAARVIAGRKHRWHRDKFLSQSMSISMAGSSKGGGMKLAGVDKAQGKREDREAADVVTAWRQHVGKLRSAVVTVNAALVAAEATEHRHQQPLVIPDIQSETMAITTAKLVPTAPRACVICGLRRDERVRGVDSDDVPDSFGEWWVEHWGHRACKNFWAEHEATLRSR